MEENEMNWEGYFAMPNDRNRERVSYSLKEELNYINREGGGSFTRGLKLVIKLVNDIPENLLIYALSNSYNLLELVSWTVDGTNNHISTISLSYKSISNDPINGGIVFRVSLPTENARLFRSSILGNLSLDHTESEYIIFKDSVVNYLKSMYE